MINTFEFWSPEKKLSNEINSDLTTNVSTVSVAITDYIQNKGEEIDINWDEELSESKSFCFAYVY